MSALEKLTGAGAGAGAGAEAGMAGRLKLSPTVAFFIQRVPLLIAWPGTYQAGMRRITHSGCRNHLSIHDDSEHPSRIHLVLLNLH